MSRPVLRRGNGTLTERGRRLVWDLGRWIRVCPCSWTAETVGDVAALTEIDCGPRHIPGCTFIAEHGENGEKGGEL